jgi:hypothetical protein
MAQFRKRPLIVDAEPVTEDGFVVERGKTLPVYGGRDWRVTDENGKTYALPDSDFRRTYEPLDEAATEMLQRIVVAVPPPRKPIGEELLDWVAKINRFLARLRPR